MEEKCIYCSKAEFKTLYRNLWDKDFFKEGKFSLKKCHNCGLEITSPLLTEKQLGDYYPSEDYYSYYDYNPLAKKYHNLSAYYHSKKNILIRAILFLFSPLLYTYYLEKGKSVLEIGCGNGMKLEIYQKYGMKTSGIEPYGPELKEKEKKLGIKKTSIKDTKYPKEKFDYIILKEVLEHIPDQETVLKKSYDWLKKEGKMIVTVPNTNGIWRKIFKENWYGYDIPRHVYHYNPKNLSKLLKKFGFKIQKIRQYDMPYMFDGSIKFYLNNKSKKKNRSIIFSNMMKILSTPLSLIATYLGQGSIMEVHCSK